MYSIGCCPSVKLLSRVFNCAHIAFCALLTECACTRTNSSMVATRSLHEDICIYIQRWLLVEHCASSPVSTRWCHCRLQPVRALLPAEPGMRGQNNTRSALLVSACLIVMLVGSTGAAVRLRRCTGSLFSPSGELCCDGKVVPKDRDMVRHITHAAANLATLFCEEYAATGL